MTDPRNIMGSRTGKHFVDREWEEANVVQGFRLGVEPIKVAVCECGFKEKAFTWKELEDRMERHAKFPHKSRFNPEP